MSKINSSLILLFISSFFVYINSKRCKRCQECSKFNNDFFQDLSNDSPLGFKTDNKYYHLENKNINIKRNKLRLSMNFTGINNRTLEPKFSVNYTVKFYNKEDVGIDEFQAEYIEIKPLYSYSILRDKPEPYIEWDVDIQENGEKEQIAQIIALATSTDNIKETFAYNSFRFTYTKSDKENKDRILEFWVIYFCFIGIIVITFIGIFVYIYSTLEIGRNTLMINNISTANLDQSEAEAGEDVPRTTV